MEAEGENMKVKDVLGNSGMFVTIVRPDGSYFEYCDAGHLGFVPVSDPHILDDIADRLIAFIKRIDNDEHNVFLLSDEERTALPQYMLWDNYSPNYVMVLV